MVNGEAFVDPRRDIATTIIRDIFSSTARNQDSFQILSENVVTESTEEISTVVRNLIKTNSVDWIVVVGGIGFEESDCTPEVSDPFMHLQKSNPTVYVLRLYFLYT